MLRIHFTDADLARTKLSENPDPLWEIGLSLHRFQTRLGRWAYAEWYRTARQRLSEKQLGSMVREMLLPLFPRAVYYPDFLNPAAASEGLTAGLSALVDTPPERVRHEVALLSEVTVAPSWVNRLVERNRREELAGALQDYYDAAIAPYNDQVQARLEAERSALGRTVLGGGVERLLAGLGPSMHWRPPVLHVDVKTLDRDLHLDRRGLLLVPSYFCWGMPLVLADSTLPQVLVYPLLHEAPAARATTPAPLAALLGRTRALMLRATAAGATTGELARVAGVSSAAASQHTTVLRDAGLISSHRHAANVLHTLTPLGASLLQGHGPGAVDRNAGAR